MYEARWSRTFSALRCWRVRRQNGTNKPQASHCVHQKRSIQYPCVCGCCLHIYIYAFVHVCIHMRDKEQVHGKVLSVLDCPIWLYIPSHSLQLRNSLFCGETATR